MALKIYLAATLLFTSFLSSAKEDVIPRPSALLPAWRTDVRTAVGTTPLGVVWGRGREFKGRPIASLWFTDKNTIVATFVTREGKGPPKVSQRDAADNTLPLRLRAIFLDATTGKITAATDWPTQSRRSLIAATLGGRFVTQRGNELTLYDSDRKDLRTANLPSLDVGDWYSHPSPTGKNIVFFSEDLWKGSWIWVETDTLRVLGSGKDTSNGFVTISDEKMAMATCFSSGRLSTRVVWLTSRPAHRVTVNRKSWLGVYRQNGRPSRRESPSYIRSSSTRIRCFCQVPTDDA